MQTFKIHCPKEMGFLVLFQYIPQGGTFMGEKNLSKAKEVLLKTSFCFSAHIQLLPSTYLSR